MTATLGSEYGAPDVTLVRLRAGLVTGYATDAELARMVRTGMRDLHHHSPAYAAALGRAPGIALAGQINAGMVESATEQGRTAMRRAYERMSIAATVPPGLDTNELIDRVTGRENPRMRHLENLRLAAADAEDRAALGANPSHR